MSEQTDPTTQTGLAGLAIRGSIGGVLMGLANLVPGISGGTMLLAAGVYPRFIEAIGEVTTLKFKRISLITLGSIILPAALAFVLLAGTVKDLVIDYRWVMYSLFIGLTLGGVPLVWRMIAHPTPSDMPVHDTTSDTPHGIHIAWIGAVVGFIAMAALALVQSAGAATDIERSGTIFFFLAGVAGASAMILPGVSGGYLLLVLGVYVPILAGVSTFKDALPILGDFDLAVLTDLGLKIVLPVGLGAIIGVVIVSNVLRSLLHHCEKATLGVLLGLLVGAVVGLWPFQQSIAPQEGDLIKGQEVTFGLVVLEETQEKKSVWHYKESGKLVEAQDLPTEYFKPTGAQIAGSLGLIVLGLGTTLMIDRLQTRRN